MITPITILFHILTLLSYYQQSFSMKDKTMTQSTLSVINSDSLLTCFLSRKQEL